MKYYMPMKWRFKPFVLTDISRVVYCFETYFGPEYIQTRLACEQDIGELSNILQSFLRSK